MTPLASFPGFPVFDYFWCANMEGEGLDSGVESGNRIIVGPKITLCYSHCHVAALTLPGVDTTMVLKRDFGSFHSSNVQELIRLPQVCSQQERWYHNYTCAFAVECTTSLVPRLSLCMNEKSKGKGEPGKTHHVRNITGRENSPMFYCTLSVVKALWSTERD